MAHNTGDSVARALTLGKQQKRQKQQNKDYAQARSDRKKKQKKQYKGIAHMEQLGHRNKPITSIADRMQARRRARNR